MVSIEQLKQLREESGMSVSECQKVLQEAGGNIEKARDLLRQRGKQLAAKKQAREVGEGLIEAYVHPTGKTGAMVDVRCETDFVARAADFKALCHELAMQVASMDPATPEELAAQAYIRDSSQTIQDVINAYIAKLGENIVVKKLSRFEI